MKILTSVINKVYANTSNSLGNSADWDRSSND